ncbi:MAG: hypothetical protein AB8G26_06895, partial [Ilumatobacter sp.]
AVTGLPAVLVPWSGAADDHQTGNVEWRSAGGGAVLPGAGEMSRLGSEMDRHRADPEATEALTKAANKRGDVHRSGALARLIERVALTSSES